mgnify:CR=1 FL=1
MRISFKEVGTILAAQFGIEGEHERSAAFRSRLQHLQRAGVPAGVNTGKGKRASYSWPQLIELIVVLDLINIGLSPEAARIAVEDHRDEVLLAAALFGTSNSEEELVGWVDEKTPPFEQATILEFSAATLLEAITGGGSFLLSQTGQEYTASLASREPFTPARCLLVLSDRILKIIEAIAFNSMPTAGGNAHRDTVASFRTWALDHHSNTPNCS